MRRTITTILAEVETLPDDWALVVLDRALATGVCTLPDLIKGVARASERVQHVVAIADARAGSTAQSLIRAAWYRANLPTPTLGCGLPTPAGEVRTVCATEYHRFAVATRASADQRGWLTRRGWRVLVVGDQRVLEASSSDLAERIRAEHLRHLGTVGLDMKAKPAIRKARGLRR